MFSKVCYTYDSSDNKIVISSNLGEVLSVEKFEYDDLGRIIKYTDSEGLVTQTLYDDFVFNKKLDRYCLKKTTIDPKGRKVVEYFESGEAPSFRQAQNALGQTLSEENYFFDLNGNQVKQVNKVFINFEEVKSITNLWEYDCLGRLQKQIESYGSPLEKTTTFKYDKSNKLLKLIKPDGVSVIYTYDDHSRVSSIKSTDGTIHYQYKYDLADRPIEEINLLTNQSTIRKYSPLGSLLSEKQESNLIIKYKYDDFGRQTRIIFPDHSAVQYKYDAFHLKKITRLSKEQEPLYIHKIDKYNLKHIPIEESSIFDVVKTYKTYDTKNRVSTTLSNPFFSQSIEEFDDSDNVKSLLTNYSEKSDTLSFSYDDQDHLIKETGFFTLTYDYDSLHNRIRKNNTNYDVNDLNQVYNEHSNSYSYDKNGNRKTKTSDSYVDHYEYDALDRLTSFTKNKLRVNYSYDSSGRRISKQVLKKASNNWKEESFEYYLYDQNCEIATFSKEQELSELRVLKSENTSEIGNSIAFEFKGQPYIPIHDLFGNVIQIVDPYKSQLVESYKYTAFGEFAIYDFTYNRVPSSLLNNKWNFQSKRMDPESGFIYFGKRYYDKQIGSWTSPDPEGLIEETNLYQYLYSNPFTHIDCWGLSIDSIDYNLLPHLLDESGNLRYGPHFGTSHQGAVVTDTILRTLRDAEFYKGKFSVITSHYKSAVENYESNVLSKYLNCINSPSTTLLKGLNPEHNKHSLIFINGINTTKTECLNMGKIIQESLPSLNLFAIHNPENGLKSDLMGAALECGNAPTSMVKHLKKELFTLLENNQHLHIFAHSRGAASLSTTLSDNCFNPYRSKIDVYTFGGAKFVKKSCGNRVLNFFSEKDPIPKLNGHYNFGYIQKNFPNTVIMLKSTTSNPLKEHSFLGDTYKKAIEDINEDIIQKLKIK